MLTLMTFMLWKTQVTKVRITPRTVDDSIVLALHPPKKSSSYKCYLQLLSTFFPGAVEPPFSLERLVCAVAVWKILIVMNFTLVKNMKPRAECLSYFDDCKRHILQEACLIGKDTYGTSMGESQHVNDSFHHVVTSTPNQKKNSIQLTSKSSVILDDKITQKNIENVDRNSLSASKVLAVVESKRKEEVQVRIILCFFHLMNGKFSFIPSMSSVILGGF